MYHKTGKEQTWYLHLYVYLTSRKSGLGNYRPVSLTSTVYEASEFVLKIQKTKDKGENEKKNEYNIIWV